MAAQNELLAEAILEDKLVDIWPEYRCLYDVSSADFKNRAKGQTGDDTNINKNTSSSSDSSIL